MDDTKHFNYILVNGYGWSGSSAVIDLFREFDDTCVPHKEFRLIKDPHGLRDLDIQLNESIDALNEDIAIREYLQIVKVYSRKFGFFTPLGLGYSVDFGEDIEKISKDFIEKLCDYKYRGHWWYFDKDKSALELFVLRSLRKLGVYKYSDHTSFNLTLKSEEQFLCLAKEYINQIFSSLLANEECSNIVLDQAVPANHSEWANRYFQDCKVIIVDRDPRDVYIDLINEKSLVGYDVAVNHDVRLFIEWFKKVRKENAEKTASNVLRLKFEDLILDYDRTISSIYDFCDLDKSLHFAPKTKLIPEKSKRNIGMWKRYQYQDEIEIINTELRDYIRNY